MSKSTENYKLIKPDLNESADINIINNNMDIIDKNLKESCNKIAILNGKGDLKEKANKDDFDTYKNEVKSSLNDIKSNTGDKAKLKTTDKTNLVSAMNELFTNANNGKTLISNVVGSPLLANDTFQQQSDKIQGLKNTLASNLTAKEQHSNSNENLQSLINKVANINVGKRFASGYTAVSECKLEVRNLNFKPTTIIMEGQGNNSWGNILGIVCLESSIQRMFSAKSGHVFNYESFDFINFDNGFSSTFRLGYGDNLPINIKWVAIE